MSTFVNGILNIIRLIYFCVIKICLKSNNIYGIKYQFKEYTS